MYLHESTCREKQLNWNITKPPFEMFLVGQAKAALDTVKVTK